MTGAGSSLPEVLRDAAPRKPGRPRDDQATAAITEATLRQLGEIGYAAMSLEGIASAAGVARATVYRRYRDKADVVTAAIASRPMPEAAADAELRAEIVAFLEHFDGRFGLNCLEVLGTLVGSREDRSALELHRERVVTPRRLHLHAMLARAAALGLLRPGTDVELAEQMLAGSVFARRIFGVDSPAGWAERAVATIWRER